MNKLMLAILAWSSIQCVHNSVSQIYSLSDCALNHVQIGCQPGEHISVLYSRMWSNINPNCNPNRMHDEKFEQIGCYASMDIISLMKYRCNGRHSCYVGDQSSFPSTGCTSKEICIKIIYQCNSKAICSTKLAECSEFPENQKKCVKRLAQWGCACPSNFCPEQNIDEQMRLCGFNHECCNKLQRSKDTHTYLCSDSPIGPLFWNGKKRLVLSEETANFVCALMEKSCKESVDCCVFANNMYGCRFKCMKITAFARKPLCKSTSIFGFPILESYQKGQLNMSCSNDSQSAMRMICTLDNGWIPLNISDFLNCGCNQEIYEFLEAFKTLFIQHSDLDFQMFRNLAVLPSWNLQTALLSAFEMSKWTSIKFDQTFIHGKSKSLIRIYEVMDMHTINLESNLFRTGNPDINTDLKLSPRFTGNTRSVETLLLLVKSEDDFRHITIWFKASSSEKDIKFQLSINLMFSKQSDLNSCDRSFIKINSKYPSCSQWNDNVSDQIKYFSHCEIVTEVINSNKSIEVFIMNDVPYNVQLTSKAVSTSTINITSETATETEATTIDLQTTANTSIECSTSSIKQVKASNSVVNCSNSKLLSNCSEIDIRVADDWLSTLENKMKEEMSASLRKKVIYLLHEGEIQFGVLKNKMKYAHFKANVSKHKMSKDTVKIFTASNLKQDVNVSVGFLTDKVVTLDDGSSIKSVSNIISIITSERLDTVNVSLTFDNQIHDAKCFKYRCGFWDTETNNTLGRWSIKGCRMLSCSSKYFSCTCNHLTAFAVLFDFHGLLGSDTVNDVSEDYEILSYVTIIGCIISMICLCIAIVIMIKLRGILDDQFNRYTAHLNLMICLLLLQVFFIIAILPVSLDSYILCKLTAICLHYFVITSFCWMFIDALDLVIVLTRGFYWYLPQKVVLILIGYGFPFLIVLVSSSFFWREYGMGIRKNICWINPGIFMIVSLGIPTFSMLLANMCFYAVVIHQMMVYSQGCKVSSNKSVRIWLRNAMSLFIMFGLTWISCFMFINRQATVFIYIFTLINSFIGVWLLIITAIMKPTIYNYIKRAIIDNISRLNERSERWSASNQSLFSYLRDYLGGKSTPLSNQRNSDSLNLMKEVRLANEVYRDEKTQYVTVQDNGSTIYFSVVNPQNS